MLMLLDDFRCPGRWCDEVHIVAIKFKGNSLLNSLRKLGLSCVVYELWRERNNRIFGSAHRSIEHIVQSCIVTIRNRFCKWKAPRNKHNGKPPEPLA
ncbi:hypothetical protein LIER_20830 [Lithospermum erythrorhizon]|uniref:Uncharacterized protein n=1 Tax=Lithospermum erythrorhizon TaxID=34254 RepID=A0AAV3QS18_LITER